MLTAPAAEWHCRSLYKNAELGGCLPRAWYNRYGVIYIPTPLGPIPQVQMMQMYANEDPKDTSQPQLVSLIVNSLPNREQQ
jgi:hypothetical protein